MNHRTPKGSKHHLVSAAVLSLATFATLACDPDSPARHADLGRLELVVADGVQGAPPCDRTHALSGTFAVQGISNRSAFAIPSDELGAGRLIRSDVTPGLYSVAWMPDGRGDGSSTRAPWTLPAAVVTSVFGGRTTTVRVERTAAPSLYVAQTR